METLKNILQESYRDDLGMRDTLLQKYCYFIICNPSKDYPNRYLILTSNIDPELNISKYKVFDRWRKKYPDDNPDHWSPWITVNPVLDPGDVKKLKKIGQLIKKGKSDVVTLHSILFAMGHPERKLDYIYNEMKKRGCGAGK